MDFFGIGSAVKGAARVYFQSARLTGRTTALINSLKDGDRVCFNNRQEAERVKNLCRNIGVDIECLVVDPKTPERLFDPPYGTGKTVLDHSWVEQFYLDGINNCTKHLDEIQRAASAQPHGRSEFADDVSRWWL